MRLPSLPAATRARTTCVWRSMNELEIGIAVAFAAGVLSFLSPCVLPLVPSYLSFVSGVGLEELEHGETGEVAAHDRAALNPRRSCSTSRSAAI